MAPRPTWALAGLVTLVFITQTLRDLQRGFASRHSPAAIARLVRKLPEPAGGPLVSYGRQWNSASFYLGRDVVFQIDSEHPQNLLDFLARHAKTQVLVESGVPLQQFLSMLPGTLKPEVHLPRQLGQAAIVIVRNPAARS
jgi:hypothetical protein